MSSIESFAGFWPQSEQFFQIHIWTACILLLSTWLLLNYWQTAEQNIGVGQGTAVDVVEQEQNGCFSALNWTWFVPSLHLELLSVILNNCNVKWHVQSRKTWIWSEINWAKSHFDRTIDHTWVSVLPRFSSNSCTTIAIFNLKEKIDCRRGLVTLVPANGLHLDTF